MADAVQTEVLRATRLDPSGTRQSPVSFSPDGKFLTFDQKDPKTKDDVMVLPLDGDRSPLAVAQSRFGEGSGKFSPDGRWVAYSSAESGQPEIYVQAFPGPGPKLQVSNKGGTDPVWRRDGGELYYRSDNKMMAVSVTTSPAVQGGCATIALGGGLLARNGLLVRNAMGRVLQLRRVGRRPAVSDGARGWSADASRIVVVLNWAEEVKAKERARTAAAPRAHTLRNELLQPDRNKSARSHALAIVHSRTTVAAEMPTTSAVSSIVRPPKYRSSTIRAC